MKNMLSLFSKAGLLTFLFYYTPLSGSTSYPFAEMSLEEKIGQLLMVHFKGEEANEDAKTLIQDVHVGAIIYYNWANGLNSPKQVRHLSTSLQELTKQNPFPIPLLIAADQEGGLVSRLNKGFTIFPGNRAIAMTGDPKLAKLCAYAMGQELRAVGVNMNLAPDADVNSNPRNPVIGIRSFSDSPEIVVEYGRKALEGYHESGIITCLKHFPGYGDVDVDAHETLPIIKKTKTQLDKVELLPFAQLAAESDTIMTAHILIPSLDPINCATLSKDILSILRHTMGFKGVIIADSLVMEGLLQNSGSVDEAAIRALDAGCEILILGGKQLIGSHANLELTVSDVQRIHQALVDAVRTGRISENRVDQAVQKILELKNRYALEMPMKEEISLETTVNTDKNHELAKKIATMALRTKVNKPLPAAFAQSKIAIFAPELARESVNQTSLLTLGKDNSSLFFKELNPSKEEIKSANDIAKASDILVFCSYNACRNTAQATLITSLLNLEKPFILICLRDPLDASLFPKAHVIITTYSPTFPSIQAACDKLTSYQSD